jgi:hypothetical protein
VVEKRTVRRGRSTTEYHLTAAGGELRGVIYALLTWGARWGFGKPRPEELDPILLLWWIRSRVHTDRLPAKRTVVEFNFRGADDGTYWLLLTRSDVSVCLQHPGYDVDIAVEADLASLFEVWLGRLSYEDALRASRVRVDALPTLMRDFPTWFAWSAAADAVRATMRDGAAEGLFPSADGGEGEMPTVVLPND